MKLHKLVAGEEITAVLLGIFCKIEQLLVIDGSYNIITSYKVKLT